MKNIKQGLVAAAAVATIGTGGFLGMQAVNAQSNTASTDPMSGLVDKLVSKFNLNKADVQKVFDENKTEMNAQRDTAISSKLQKLVDTGTITAAQQSKIEAKLKELKTARESNKDTMKNLSRDERRAKMETKRAELESWAKENGINLSTLQGIFMGGHGGPGGPRGEGPRDKTETN